MRVPGGIKTDYFVDERLDLLVFLPSFLDMAADNTLGEQEMLIGTIITVVLGVIIVRNWKHREIIAQKMIYWGSTLFLLLVVVLSMILSLILAFTALAYLLKPYCEPSLHVWMTEFAKNHHGFRGWLLADLRDTVRDDGQDCLRTSSTIITSATLLVTVGLLVINRAFSDSIETVKTIGGCHDRYFKLLTDWNLSKPRSAVHAFAGYYHCEYHYYVRGMLPTDVFSVWMHSWVRWCGRESTATVVEASGSPTVLAAAFTEEVSGIGDSDFEAFYQKLFMQTPEGKPAPSGTNDLKHARATLIEARRKWQIKRYGRLLAFLIRFIDRER